MVNRRVPGEILKPKHVIVIAAILGAVLCAEVVLYSTSKSENPIWPPPTAATQQVAQPTPVVQESPAPDFLKDDLVFHGLKLGIALNDQLPKCQVRSEGTQNIVLGEGLCYLATSFGVDKGSDSAYVEIRRGGQSAVEPDECQAGECTYRQHIIVHILPAGSRESGTVESVNSFYPPEQFDNIRLKLGTDYGSPTDNNGWIHYSTPWGRVNLTNWKYAVSVEAESARIEALTADAVRRALAEAQPTKCFRIGGVFQITAGMTREELDDHFRDTPDPPLSCTKELDQQGNVWLDCVTGGMADNHCCPN